jgi:sigma-B regulation protein RsbU (phosphoserine phosphatase)
MNTWKRILIAEDDAVSCKVLEATLTKWGYEVVVTRDGEQAWKVLQNDDAPPIAILDWMMPGTDGVEVCRRVRMLPRTPAPYVILLTAKGTKEDIVTGLEAGADDYLIKPFDRAELRARLNVGVRVLGLQHDLAQRIAELQEAIAKVKLLQGMLPICCYCKKIRDDQNYWQGVENYIAEHAEVQFSHGVCPDCYDRVLKPQLEELKKQRADPVIVS